jgi:hypothetical protein
LDARGAGASHAIRGFESPYDVSHPLSSQDVSTRADDLATLTVLDDAGQAIPVGSFWKDRTAVLAFVRHFG